MDYYIVDAFSSELFKGNQAGVCILKKWPSSELMQNIAFENNLSETAFVVKEGESYGLKWFTPGVEVDLCGHATLGAAFIVFNFVDKEATKIDFETLSGRLTVYKNKDLLEMDFPARKPEQIDIEPIMEEAIGEKVSEAHLSRDLLLLLDSEEKVKNLKPNLKLIEKIPHGMGLIVTASSKKYDFVSRFFAPKVAVDEDPVTGSSHSTLVPFWAERLNKNIFHAKQVSKRSGELFCENNGERVKISGRAVLYLKGKIMID